MEYIEKIYSYYLTKKQVEKLVLLKKIFVKKSISIKEFCEESNKTTYQLRNLLYEIEENINIFSKQEKPIFTIGKKNIYLTEEMKQEYYLDLFVKLRKTYFIESPYYQLLIYMFKKRRARVVEISNNLVFSTSYCYKLLRYLRKMLTIQNMPITLDKNKDTIELNGEEMCIRMYFYLIEILANNVYIEVNIRSAIDLLAKEYEPLRTTKIKHDLMFSIIENSVTQGYFINSDCSSSIEIFGHLSELYDETPVRKALPIRTEKDSRTELIYYYFWAMLFIPETVTEDEKIILGEKFIRIENNQIIDFSNSIIDKLSEKYELDDNTIHKLVYEIVVNTWGYQNLYLDKFMSKENLSLYLDSGKEVEAVVENSLKKSSLNIKNKGLFIQKMGQIIGSYVPLQKNEVLSIGISTLNHPEYISVIKNILLKIYNGTVLHFTEHLEQADILVSDGVLIHSENQEFAFLGNIHNTNDWEHLNTLIQTSIVNRCK